MHSDLEACSATSIKPSFVTILMTMDEVAMLVCLDGHVD